MACFLRKWIGLAVTVLKQIFAVLPLSHFSTHSFDHSRVSVAISSHHTGPTSTVVAADLPANSQTSSTPLAYANAAGRVNAISSASPGAAEKMCLRFMISSCLIRQSPPDRSANVQGNRPPEAEARENLQAHPAGGPVDREVGGLTA